MSTTSIDPIQQEGASGAGVSATTELPDPSTYKVYRPPNVSGLTSAKRQCEVPPVADVALLTDLRRDRRCSSYVFRCNHSGYKSCTELAPHSYGSISQCTIQDQGDEGGCRESEGGQVPDGEQFTAATIIVISW
jgi:hypothetical protein